MNAATTPYPKPDLATSHRLRACVASFGLIGLAAIWRERDDIAGLIVHILTFPVLIWVAWIGAFRSPFLHRLWGGVCLVGSVAIIVLLGLGLSRLREFRFDQFSWVLVIGVIQMPILAYLLIFDRKISAYRRQLADREPHFTSL